MGVSDEIARGWDLFRLGALAEAESLVLESTHDLQAVRLLLWIAIRRNDHEQKCCWGSVLANSGDSDLAAVGRAHENAGRAALRLDGLPWLEPSSRWAKAEVAYARGLIAFMEDRSLGMRDELSAALPQNAEQRVRFAALRSWVPVLHDNFERHAPALLRALLIALDNDVDRTLVAQIAASLAFVLREVELGELASHADALFSRIEWPVDNLGHRYYGQWAIAWRKATIGEWVPAMKLLNETLAIAPDIFSKALIYAEQARISRALGERVADVSSRAFAFEAIDTVSLESASNGEGVIVLSMMDVLAGDRQKAWGLFRSLSPTKVSRMLGEGHGSRYEAFKNLALSHLTDGEESLRYAQVAYHLFKTMKFVHRATDCALRAIQVGGGSRWRTRVERLLERYPRSLLARQFECYMFPLNQIRGRRRELLISLATTTDSAKSIGKSLGMAESTVRDHIKALYRTLRIENRLQLMRMFLESNHASGLFDEELDDLVPSADNSQHKNSRQSSCE